MVPEGFTEALVRQMGYSEEHEQFRISDVISGKLALAIHAVYGKSPGPELFISNPTDATTARLAGFLSVLSSDTPCRNLALLALSKF